VKEFVKERLKGKELAVAVSVAQRPFVNPPLKKLTDCKQLGATMMTVVAFGGEGSSAAGMVYLSCDTALVALEAATGRVRWQYRIAHPAYGVLQAETLVLWSPQQKVIVGLDARTGRLRWQQQVEQIWQRAIYADGFLFLITRQPRRAQTEISCFDCFSGVRCWRKQFAGYLKNEVGVTAEHLYAYVSSRQQLVVLERITGTLKHSISMPVAPIDIVAADQRTVVVNRSGALLEAYRAEQARPVWEHVLRFQVVRCLSAGEGRCLFVASTRGPAQKELVCLETTTGRELMKVRLPEELSVLYVSNDDELGYLRCRNYRRGALRGKYSLRCYELKTGRMMWQFDVPSELRLASQLPEIGGRHVAVSLYRRDRNRHCYEAVLMVLDRRTGKLRQCLEPGLRGPVPGAIIHMGPGYLACIQENRLVIYRGEDGK
jgi:outer membrane protein assembly factor BamB